LGIAFSAAAVVAALRINRRPRALVDIAVVSSRVGDGVSSLVNFLRGVRTGDEGWTFGTEVCTAYDWRLAGIPVRLWDCPRVYPTETQSLSHFHFIILVHNTWWPTRDDWLIQFCQDMGIKFCLVRTELDAAFESHIGRQVLQKYREGTTMYPEHVFQRHGIQPSRLYLFTSRPDMFEKYRDIFGPEKDRFMRDLEADVQILHQNLQRRARRFW